MLRGWWRHYRGLRQCDVSIVPGQRSPCSRVRRHVASARQSTVYMDANMDAVVGEMRTEQFQLPRMLKEYHQSATVSLCQ